MRQKVFGIGFNKTGTTTLESVLRYYGYSLPDQAYQEKMITRSTFDGNYQPMIDLVGRFEAFQDMPFSQGSTYMTADKLFPDSKFILTIRDPEQWFASLCQFHKKLFNIESLGDLTESHVRTQFHYLYDGYVYENIKRFLTDESDEQKEARWDLLYNKDYYIERYLKRNDAIRKYFSSREGALLVIDLTKEQTTKSICDFLEIPSNLTIPMPHENSTISLPSKLHKRWSKLLKTWIGHMRRPL